MTDETPTLPPDRRERRKKLSEIPVPPGFGIPEKIGSIPGDREYHERLLSEPLVQSSETSTPESSD